MFDSEYFRTALQADVKAVGGDAVVAMHLVSGREHLLRSVISVHNAYVTVEAFQARADEPTHAPRWRSEASAAAGTSETERAVVAYECIEDVTIKPAWAGGAGIGFARS